MATKKIAAEKKSSTPAKKAVQRAAPAKEAPGKPAPLETRLALDRYLMGLWIERDLAAFLAAKSDAAAPLAKLSTAAGLDRQKAARGLRKQLFGAERPTDLDQFEALMRQAVDCVVYGMPVLLELQHDLMANADVVERTDPRSDAMRVLADYAAASQVNVAVQTIGRLAEATTDRVANARRDATTKLKKLLVDFTYLMPGESA